MPIELNLPYKTEYACKFCGLHFPEKSKAQSHEEIGITEVPEPEIGELVSLDNTLFADDWNEVMFSSLGQWRVEAYYYSQPNHSLMVSLGKEGQAPQFSKTVFYQHFQKFWAPNPTPAPSATP